MFADAEQDGDCDHEQERHTPDVNGRQPFVNA
jgi:hypothetical protein